MGPGVLPYLSKVKGLRLQTSLTALTEIKGVSGVLTNPALGTAWSGCVTAILINQAGISTAAICAS